MSGDRESGFTLLEVLVAFAIAGAALALLFRAGGESVVAVGTASRYEEAVQRAQSHLAAVGRDAALLQGESEGDDGGGYRWHLRIAPVAIRQVRVTGAREPTTEILFEVEAAISWPGRAGDRSVRLRTRRIGTAAPGR